MARTRCPQCNTASPLPDIHLGKKVRCKKCANVFVAQADVSPAGSVVAGGNTTAGLSVLANQSASTETANIATVVAKPVNEPASAGLGPALAWVAVLLAFALPVSGASWFVLRNWTGNSPASKGTEETYGVIEIGSGSVKFTVFKWILREDEEDCVPLEQGNVPTTLINDMDQTSRFHKVGLEQTRTAVRTFAEAMHKEHGLSNSRIHVIAGSSPFKPLLESKKLGEGQREEKLREARNSLTELLRESNALPVVFVDLESEVRYQIIGVVPQKHRKTGLYVDIGGGSTRGGYFGTKEVVRPMSGPGVKGFLKKMTAIGGDPPFANAAARLADMELHKPFREAVANDRGLTLLRHIYLNGGVVWVAANIMHPAERGPKVPLTTQDLRDFAKRVGGNPHYLKEFVPPADMPARDRAALAAEVKVMDEKIAPDYLVAGAQILLALVEELELDDDDKDLVFYRHGEIAWTLAYTVETVRKGS